MKLNICGAYVENVALEEWTPRDPSRVVEFVGIEIGPASGDGADMFSVRVCTPKGLLMLQSEEGVIASRHMVVLETYSYQVFIDWVQKVVSSAEDCNDWKQCVENLRRFFSWEYDCYNEVEVC